MARQAERTARTRELLIGAAADRFVRDGFAATSLEELVAAAGVSKGALYHHFSSKADLLEAVFDAVSRETIARAMTAAAGVASPRQALALSLKAWLRASQEPRPRAVLLDIGPAVLGFRRARVIENVVSEALVRQAVERAVSMGDAECDDPRLTTKLLNAAVTELALSAAEEEPGANPFPRLEAAIDRLVLAFLPPPAAGG